MPRFGNGIFSVFPLVLIHRRLHSIFYRFQTMEYISFHKSRNRKINCNWGYKCISTHHLGPSPTQILCFNCNWGTNVSAFIIWVPLPLKSCAGPRCHSVQTSLMYGLESIHVSIRLCSVFLFLFFFRDMWLEVGYIYGVFLRYFHGDYGS